MADGYQFIDFEGTACNQEVSTLAKQFHQSCSIVPEDHKLSGILKIEATTSKPSTSRKRKQGVNENERKEWFHVRMGVPGIPYKDIGRVLARRWYKMSAEDHKALHEAAEADKSF